MTASGIGARREELFRRASSAALIGSLLLVTGMDEEQPSGEHKMVIAWIRTELEMRHPQAALAVEQAFDDAVAEEDRTGQPVDVDYNAILIGAIESAA